MQPAVSRKRFTVDDYCKMLDAGILQKGDRAELISGEVLEMSPIGSKHAATVYCIDSTLKTALGDLAIVRIQLPVHIDDFNEPEPGIAVVQPRTDIYVAAHPNPSDALLLVEVSDTTLDFDRTVKAPLYALAVSSTVREALLHLHPATKKSIRKALESLIADPYAGKPLKEELSGLSSLPVSRYRINYQTRAGRITVVYIGPRRNVYERLRELLTK